MTSLLHKLHSLVDGRDKVKQADIVTKEDRQQAARQIEEYTSQLFAQYSIPDEVTFLEIMAKWAEAKAFTLAAERSKQLNLLLLAQSNEGKVTDWIIRNFSCAEVVKELAPSGSEVPAPIRPSRPPRHPLKQPNDYSR